MKYKKCKVFCINSVKGGCGKTTVALSLTHTIMSNLEAEYTEKVSETEENADKQKIQAPKVCYIDLDILGTGVEYIIYGEYKKELSYLNMIDTKTDSFEEFKKYINIIERHGSNLPVDCILLSPNAREKKTFLKSGYNNEKAHNMNIFQKRAEKLLKTLIEKRIYDAIIIDLSPGYEDFQRGIYRCLKELKKNTSEENKSIEKVYNLFVTTLENAHVLTTISTLVDILKDQDIEFENFRAVFNDLNGNFEQSNESINTIITREEFEKEVLEKFNEFYSKELRNIDNKHEPAQHSFSKESILIKKWCENMGNKYVFARSECLSGNQELGEMILDDGLTSSLLRWR